MISVITLSLALDPRVIKDTKIWVLKKRALVLVKPIRSVNLRDRKCAKSLLSLRQYS